MSHIQQSTVAVSVTSPPLEGYPGQSGATADPGPDPGGVAGVVTGASQTNGVFQRRPGGRTAFWQDGGGGEGGGGFLA